MMAGHPNTVNNKPVSLQIFTTMRIGGTRQEDLSPHRCAEFTYPLSMLTATCLYAALLAAGSNMLVSDDDFNGVVVRDARRKVSILDGKQSQQGHLGAADALRQKQSTNWDDFVEYTIRMGMEGVKDCPASQDRWCERSAEYRRRAGKHQQRSVQLQVWDRKAQKGH